MGWMERLFGEAGNRMGREGSLSATEERMRPGMDGDYDLQLREKAGLREPPPPPEYMGLEGEYDLNGLLKRVALAFDRDPLLSDLPDLQVSQQDSTIVLRGTVPNQMVLDRLTETAGKVDGTKAVDTSQVKASM